MRLIKFFLIGLFLLFIIGLLALNFMIPFRKSDEKIKEYFTEKKVKLNIHHADYQGNKLRLFETGSNVENSALLVLVHGAPGSAVDMQSFLADSLLLEKCRMIAPDRPGYGYSGYGVSEISLAKQAEVIDFIVKKFPAKKVILAGHSYGGPIIAKYAMDHPESVDAIVMLAPVNDPDNEKIFWYAHFGKWKLTRWILPKAFRVSADEKFSHAEELAKIKNGWSKLSVPTIHVHGKKDGLAPIANIDFSQKNIPPDVLEMIILEDAGHLLPWFNFDEMRDILLRVVEN